MGSSRKRGRQEMEAVDPPREPTLLKRIRNSWEFANLAQWIYTFGRAVKIDENLDIADLEMECLNPHSTILSEIGLALLKFVSSHRGLTPETFDEYTRRQYVAKAPGRNPFGVGEDPNCFKDFDVFTKIRVLQQLTVWTMVNPDRIRERMEEQKDTEQTLWRIEPYGWDAQDRTYIVLDDNRLYRRTDPPLPPTPEPKPKRNSKKGRAMRRASRQQKAVEQAESETERNDEAKPEKKDNDATAAPEDDGFGGMAWECIAVTLDEFNTFVASIEKSRDPNEKSLRKRIVDEILPILEKQEESRKRKQAQKERELMNLEKLATAKRSSRIAGRMEQKHHEEEQREAERKKVIELALAKKEQEKWQKLEKERDSRMQTREQRLKEREARRILHEEELANLSENGKKLESGEARLSERQMKAEIERKKAALEELEQEDDWIFDCICGVYGQVDDGTHSIACDTCNIWQHSKCAGVSQKEAERDDFAFICTTCQNRGKDAEKAKTHPPIKLVLKRPGSSSSSTAPKSNGSLPANPLADGNLNPQISPQKVTQPSLFGGPIQFPRPNGEQHHPAQSGPHPSMLSSPAPVEQSNGCQLSPQRPSGRQAATSYQAPSPYGVARAPSSHVFSSPHPHIPTSLPQPGQPPVFTFGPNGSYKQSNPAPQNTPIQPARSAAQSSPAGNYIYGTTPASHVLNGPGPGSSDGGHHRSSFNMPSPLAGVPVLTPNNKPNPPPVMAPNSNTPPPTSTPAMLPKSSPPPPPSWQPAISHDPSDSGHASALPSATTGLSPTKHSPPRQISNGSFSSATPSIIPPVASLTPSSPLQDLSPPIKHSEAPRPNAQAAAQ
ncbi:uncharacterized protein L3040_003203 [Drepanopeziza brunnea f. sp. 'multigermtubi']|uniref:PHD-finger domain-containing protein n=1 Tax=Marssonina brunnea f. sp. multigermtubi (strain MB_m1) TaxID=1072389 RepID=K1WEP7_MARBU|nr:PHD-finger domain-containing protein [Drepanopeziza brunnea f. sp. 'multigermtubi' MB_m1]EKD15940.1 PHD-finger domain-containing protein [Drepanopeziza brunnea f. sp. 'multigermtubi' MB_m1]KAJ5047376.1 hypothetical protein L3040_003203 [Drepanopeziza brunnea f. sp. 'multigermtubi']